MNSCKKDGTPNQTDLTGVDIYVVGSQLNGATYIPSIPVKNSPLAGTTYLPVMWKNGIINQLNYHGLIAKVFDIYFTSNDLYCAGYTNDGESYFPTIWKNDTPQYLTVSSPSTPNSIFVSGSNTYLGGIQYLSKHKNGASGIISKFWNNGISTLLTNDSLSVESWVNSVAINGNDIYLAGYDIDTVTGNSTNHYTAKMATYWKNGFPIHLTDGKLDAIATKIIISNNDVYIAGYEGYKVKYWKNETPVTLGNIYTGGGSKGYNDDELDYLFNSDFNSDYNHIGLEVIGSDVYVSGNPDGKATYWKNGNTITLTDGTKPVFTKDIAVVGTDVYVLGDEINGSKTIVKYWKNGKSVTVSDSSKDCYSKAFVVTRKGN